MTIDLSRALRGTIRCEADCSRAHPSTKREPRTPHLPTPRAGARKTAAAKPKLSQLPVTKDDFDLDDLLCLQKEAVDLYRSLAPHKPIKWRSARRNFPPGGLCQLGVASHRAEVIDETMKAVKRSQEKGFVSLAVTVVLKEGMVEPGKLTARAFERVRRPVRDACRRLKAEAAFVGFVDLNFDHDPANPNNDRWQIHAHLLALVQAPDVAEATRLLKGAFAAFPSCTSSGIRAPVMVKPTKKARGGRRGWLRYGSKGMQLSGVRLTQPGRKGTRPLTNPELRRELARVLVNLPPEKRLIIVGGFHRGGKVTLHCLNRLGHRKT